MSEAYPRIVGALTLGYGAYTLVRPESLKRVARFGDGPGTEVLVRSIGVRDCISGLSLLLARRGPWLRSAVLARVAADLSDVVAFGAGASPAVRWKAMTIAGGWAVICAGAYPAAGDPAEKDA